MKRSQTLIFVLVALAFAAGAFVYPALPERAASHWNSAGEVNGYMGRFWGAFLMPFVMLGAAVLFLAIPRLDPMKENIKSFRNYFDGFIFVILIFFLYVYALTIFWNLDYRFDFTMAILPALSVLFYSSGVLIGKTRRNWFIGIRTPWTLSSDSVWEKTHRLGEKLFKLAALISLVGLLFPSMAIYFFFIPVIVAAVASVGYSYLVYKREQIDARI